MKSQFQREAFKHGVRELLKPDGFFSVSRFNQLAAMAGVYISRQDQLYFDAIHCVHYRDMTREFKESLVQQIGSIFSQGQDPLLAGANALCVAVDNKFNASIAPHEFLALVK